MRQVFSSLRLETVEGVAELLNQHGIQTRITNGRSYKGNRRSRVSYIEGKRGSGPMPTVWIVFPDDQPRARELLREAGLMDTTRDSYLPESIRRPSREPTPVNFAARARVWLLIVVVLLGGFTVIRGCQQREPVQSAPAATPGPSPVPAAQDPDGHIISIDTSLIRPAEPTE